MPVQFVCSRCHRRLSVSQRKAGTTVACPKCGHPNLVPGAAIEISGAAAVDTKGLEPQGEASSSVSALVTEPSMPQQNVVGLPSNLDVPAFDDVLQLISDQPSSVVPPAPAAAPWPAPVEAAPSVAPVPPPPPPPPPIPTASTFEPALPASSSTSARGTARRRVGRGNGTVLLITRKTIYAQAALMGGMVLLAFVAGFAIGRSGRSVTKSSTARAADEPVPLEGYVLYALTPGESLPDAGATVMALPVGKKATMTTCRKRRRPRRCAHWAAPWHVPIAAGSSNLSCHGPASTRSFFYLVG